MRKLVLATRNEHKVKEYLELLHGLAFDIKTLNDYPQIPPIEEDGNTYTENAVKKAVWTSNYTGELSLGDDSGLEVDTLGGKPGIHSARFAPDDTSRIRKLLQSLDTTHPKDRGAHFICVVAIAEPHGQVWTLQGSCQGMISPTPVGDNGFGYDPIFLMPELKKTFAQLNSLQKGQYGHRGKAVRNARLVLNKISTQAASPIVNKDESHKVSRYASIDIGTNCLRLLIVEVDKDKKFIPFLRHSEIVRLGQGMADKRLTPGGIHRVCQQMEKYLDILKKHPVLEIHIGATSAVREAENQEDLLNAFEDKFKLKVRVLQGEEEAHLTYLGATSEFPSEHLLVVDIGGGSTEFIKGNNKKLEKAYSLNIGSVRYTEKYIYHDPPLPMEIDIVVKRIQDELKALDFGKVDSSVGMVGTGGTMTTLASMSQHLEKYDSSKIHGYIISIRDVELLAEELGKRSIEERTELPGLDPKRADVILVGVLICREVMHHFNFNEFIVSERDLLDGLLLSQIMTSKPA